MSYKDIVTKTNSFISTVTDSVKLYTNVIIMVGVLALGLIGWRGYQSYQKAQLAQRMQEDQRHQGELKVLNDQIAVLSADKNTLAQNNKKLEADVNVWRQRAQNSQPPAPVSHPPELQKVVTDLSEAGVPFTLTVAKVGDAPINGTASTPTLKLPTVWTWYKESQRVPTLETAYTAQLGLSNALTVQVTGLKEEIGKDNQLNQKQGETLQKHAEREANLETIVKDTQKEVKREEFNGYLKAIGAAILGYYVGRGVSK